jgi:flagellar biosynthesis/type III secretory pathway protein FliH
MAKGREEGMAKGREEGMAKGREEGMAKGREEGMAKGREEGLAKGREEGVAKGRAGAKVELAAKMVRDGLMDADAAAGFAGVDAADVRRALEKPARP